MHGYFYRSLIKGLLIINVSCACMRFAFTSDAEKMYSNVQLANKKP
ncbi:hypothetical protein BFV95_2102 [Alteromonas macleodii]|uniref:Lipoprotein n=1 Tax=Alteromonas macleodii TaxID=28108 RepID=A0AB36FRW4_ALTMA|nr:hypothetical protein BFV95_2102 [Alteromonas macleodii]